MLRISDGTTALTFEIDLLDNGVAAGNIRVNLRGALTNHQAAIRLRNAINGAAFRVSATATDAQIVLAGVQGLDLSGLSGGVNSATMAVGRTLTIGSQAALADASKIVITDALGVQRTLEMDRNGSGVTAGNVKVDLVGVLDNADAAARLRSAINGADVPRHRQRRRRANHPRRRPESRPERPSWTQSKPSTPCLPCRANRRRNRRGHERRHQPGQCRRRLRHHGRQHRRRGHPGKDSPNNTNIVTASTPLTHTGGDRSLPITGLTFSGGQLYAVDAAGGLYLVSDYDAPGFDALDELTA